MDNTQVVFYFTREVRDKIKDVAIDLASERGGSFTPITSKLIRIVADERIQPRGLIALEGVKKSRISVTMSFKEKASITIKAFEAGVSASDYVAQAILNNDTVIDIFRTEY